MIIIGSGDYAFPDEGTIFTIHLFSFKGVDEARSKVNEFNELGYNAFYRQESAEDGLDVCNVYIERFNTRAEAEKEADILKELDLISGYDVREIIERAENTAKKEKEEPKDETKVYSLHTASYRESSNADSDVLRLSAMGLKAFSVKADITGEQWFRVYVGEFSDENEARKAGDELLNQGIITYFKIMILAK